MPYVRHHDSWHKERKRNRRSPATASSRRPEGVLSALHRLYAKTRRRGASIPSKWWGGWLMKEICLSVPHAILFVNDPAHGHIEIPDYVPGQITSANPSCVSVNTRADVDGDVTVRLGPALPECEQAQWNTVAEHCIDTPGRTVGDFHIGE